MKKIFVTAILATTFLFIKAQAQKDYNIRFNLTSYKSQVLTVNGKSIRIRAFEKIIYVQNPIDTIYQVMNIYVPEEYFDGKTINGYSAQTAPIFFPNQIGGYMPSKPASTVNNPMEGLPPMEGVAAPKIGQPGAGTIPPMMDGEMGGSKKTSAVLVALSKGYVVASAGARGRTTKDAQGKYTGKAPAAIVDLKAAIRYLRYNDMLIPGDAGKIISNGTSAGGAMSTLVGATGNNADYESYLKVLGAAPGTDEVFAVSAYCPITNLENADIAYEWQFFGINTAKSRGMVFGPNQDVKATQLTEKQIKTSSDLNALFPAYLNGLGLKDTKGNKLTLDAKGNGPFKDLVKSYVISSAQDALDLGTDLSKYTWLKIAGKNVTGLDFDAYLAYMQRQKMPPAFDALDLSSGENQEFGTTDIDKQHFTKYSAKNTEAKGSTADAKIIKMINPMTYIGAPGTLTAKHWRIRHGTNDKDTGLAISVILATYLQNKGFDVNFELPWDKPHSGDYDLEELFQWTDSICKE
jgi:hypothetical protein